MKVCSNQYTNLKLSDFVLKVDLWFQNVNNKYKKSSSKFLEVWQIWQHFSNCASDTSDFTKRTITPVMASLAELLRNTKKYQTHYDWFVDLARNFHDVRISLLLCNFYPKSLYISHAGNNFYGTEIEIWDGFGSVGNMY